MIYWKFSKQNEESWKRYISTNGQIPEHSAVRNLLKEDFKTYVKKIMDIYLIITDTNKISNKKQSKFMLEFFELGEDTKIPEGIDDND